MYCRIIELLMFKHSSLKQTGSVHWGFIYILNEVGLVVQPERFRNACVVTCIIVRPGPWFWLNYTRHRFRHIGVRILSFRSVRRVSVAEVPFHSQHHGRNQLLWDYLQFFAVIFVFKHNFRSLLAVLPVCDKNCSILQCFYDPLPTNPPISKDQWIFITFLADAWTGATERMRTWLHCRCYQTIIASFETFGRVATL